MSERFDYLLERLQNGLQCAEKRHREAYAAASDKHSWNDANHEADIALRITNWRKTLDSLRKEISESLATRDEDISDDLFDVVPLTTEQLQDEAFGQVDDGDDGDNGCENENLNKKEILSIQDATGKKPTQLKILGKHYEVRNWTDLYIKVCEVLLLHRPYVIAELDKGIEFNSDRRIHFSYIQSDIKYSPKRLSNGLWIETNNNANTLLSMCYWLIDKCGLAKEDILITTTGDCD